MHEAVGEGVGVGEDFVGESGVGHVLLDAEVGDAEIKVEGGAHADGGEIGGAVAAGFDVVEVGEAGDAAHVGDAAGVDDSGADVVD